MPPRQGDPYHPENLVSQGGGASGRQQPPSRQPQPRRQRQPANPPSDAEDILAQVSDELGIDLSATLGAGGLGAGADPYAIFSGVAATDRVGNRVQPPTMRRTNIPLGAQGAGRATVQARPARVSYTNVGEVLKKFYRLGPAALRRFQALLYAGGFYGNMDLTDIRWGQADEASFEAWAQAVARTARLNAAGQNLTWEQVLHEAAFAAGLNPFDMRLTLGTDAQVEDLLSSTTDQGDVLTVALTDPASLRASIDQVSSAVLGRKANPAEQRMYVSLMHSMQREGQITQQTADRMASRARDAGRIVVGDQLGFNRDQAPTPGDTVVEYTQPDAEATAEEMLRRENPGEAGAHDVAIQVAHLLDLLNAPVDVPRITI